MLFRSIIEEIVPKEVHVHPPPETHYVDEIKDSEVLIPKPPISSSVQEMIQKEVYIPSPPVTQNIENVIQKPVLIQRPPINTIIANTIESNVLNHTPPKQGIAKKVIIDEPQLVPSPLVEKIEEEKIPKEVLVYPPAQIQLVSGVKDSEIFVQKPPIVTKIPDLQEKEIIYHPAPETQFIENVIQKPVTIYKDPIRTFVPELISHDSIIQPKPIQGISKRVVIDEPPNIITSPVRQIMYSSQSSFHPKIDGNFQIQNSLQYKFPNMYTEMAQNIDNYPHQNPLLSSSIQRDFNRNFQQQIFPSNYANSNPPYLQTQEVNRQIQNYQLQYPSYMPNLLNRSENFSFGRPISLQGSNLNSTNSSVANRNFPYSNEEVIEIPQNVSNSISRIIARESRPATELIGPFRRNEVGMPTITRIEDENPQIIKVSPNK